MHWTQLISYFCLAVCAYANAAGQAAAISSTSMPKDPAALLVLAAQVNGLSSPDLKPWHMKATYQAFDDDGKPEYSGVFEEWWAAPQKYKISYASPTFHQTAYLTNSGYFLAGDKKLASIAEQMFLMDMIRPLPANIDTETMDYTAKEVHIGDVTLNCVTGTQKASPDGSRTPTFCFGKELPAIRLKAAGSFETSYNSLVLFQKHYLAKQILVTKANKPMVQANVTLLELQDQIDDADFTPPSEAVRFARKIVVSTKVLAANLMDSAPPVYPAIARAARIQGTVVLKVRVSTEGAVEDAKVISGPPMLQTAAIDSVKHWRYKPYLLNGEPVQVESLVNVVFNLDR